MILLNLIIRASKDKSHTNINQLKVHTHSIIFVNHSFNYYPPPNI